MTVLQRLQIEQSEKRQRLNELLAEDKLTDEQRSELSDLTGRMQELEVELRAAIIAEPAPVTTTTPATEDRERVELRSRARLGNFLLAALQGRSPSGAEAELQAAAGASGIPMELLDHELEQRADAATGAPSTVGVNLQPILPSIFARAVLPRLGVDMPRVGSGTYASLTVTTDLTAGAKAKGAAQESTAAAFTGVTTTPHRVSARLSIRIEDVAAIGTGNFEAILRQNLQLAMSDRLDRVGLTGSGTDPEPQGLLTQQTDPTDPGTVIDWEGFIALAAGGIDGGPWAESMGAVRLVVNTDTMRIAEITFQGTDAERSAAAYLRAETGGFFGSSRMPDTASNIAQVLRFRSGTSGLDGVNAPKTATCPVWNELAIDDIYSDAASGTRHFTLHALIGDVLIHYPAAYERVDVKLA